MVSSVMKFFEFKLVRPDFADEGSFATNDTKNELKKVRAMTKAVKQAELKRLA